MLRYHQTSVPKIKATVGAFNREGFHVIRNALTQSDLRAVLSDVTETTRRANESSGWANMFSHIDKQGCLRTNSDRQMTMMDDRGAAAAVCQKLVSENLGSGGQFQMEVRAVTLMNTLAENDQPNHTDYGVDNAGDWGIGFPVSGIVCFEEGSTFSTVVGSLDDKKFEKRVEIDLHLGDVVLFHGAKVHRGARCPTGSKSLHVNAACRRFKAPENKTYPVDVPRVN